MSKDPTATLTLRNRTVAECNARFERIRREVLAAFSLGDYSDKPWPFATSDPILVNVKKAKKKKPKKGYKKPAYKAVTGAPSILGPEDVGNGYVFQRNEANLHNFDKWMQGLIDREILQPSVPLPDKWLSKPLGTSYAKGADSTRRKAAKPLAKKGVALSKKHPFTNPAHVDRARMAYLRTYNDMEGVTSTMKTQMRRILAEGIMRGENPNEIGDRMADRVNKIGKVRGRLIARTEIVEVHQEAALTEAEQIEAETGYVINMEWSTALDGRERDTHRARNGKIYTKEVARTLMGEPNCRCSLNPHISV
jgi:SPP1 gp7 family putative phage head morphogenesis protein